MNPDTIKPGNLKINWPRGRIGPRLAQILKWLIENARWETILVIILFIGVSILAFYNLGLNPRPWHDEGASLIVPRTLVEDGVYAMRNSDGYQTFGAIQSVGPTVLLPVALSYKLFGVGLVQGRIVAVIYLLITLLVFYFAGKGLFGRHVALLSILFLISSPAVRYFLYGRQVLGEIPALGFFLAGWLAWAQAAKTRKIVYTLIAGLLLGLTLVTKSQYLIMIFGTLAIIFILDLLYYRRGIYKTTVIVGIIAIFCFAAWQGWQYAYYGQATFLENAAKLRLLASETTGFHLNTVVIGFRSILGADSGNLYLFWVIPALIYVILTCIPRDTKSETIAFLVIFSILWLGYYTFWTIPWQRYAIPAMSIFVFFIAKLYFDLASAFVSSARSLWLETRQSFKSRILFTPKALTTIGTLVALLSFVLWMGYQFQQIVRSDVLDKQGNETANIFTPQLLWAPSQVVAFLDETVNKTDVVETWERELGILTDHNYHFPDQVLLANADAAIYHGVNTNYQLGEKYFSSIQPTYVVIGFYSRFNNIYDMQYIKDHFNLIKTIAYGDWRYDIYKKN